MISRETSRLQRFYETNFLGFVPSKTHPPFWLWPNLLSLDAPLIAVLWQTVLVRDLGIHLPRGEPLILAAVIWLVYLADRLLDVSSPTSAGRESARKIFYRQHGRIAAVFGVTVALALLPAAYFLLGRSTFYSGLKLAVPLVGYILLVHVAPTSWRAKWPRELVVACMFALGTFLAVWTASGENLHLLCMPAILFAALCFANIAAIETFEWQADGHSLEGRPSRSAHWLAQNLVPAAILIACAAAVLARTGPAEFYAAASLSGGALAALGLNRFRLPPNVMRVAADVALCTPALILAISAAR